MGLQKMTACQHKQMLRDIGEMEPRQLIRWIDRVVRGRNGTNAPHSVFMRELKSERAGEKAF